MGRKLGSPLLHQMFVLLVITAQCFGTLSTLAALEISDRSQSPSSNGQEPSGVLFVTGQVSVNGNIVQTGFTIFKNSTIATGSDGKALVDLGNLGRIEIRGSAVVVLTFTQVSVDLKSQCTRSKIIVTRGQVVVKSPRQESIVQGKDESYDGPTEVTTDGATDFIVDCNGKDSALPKPAKRRGLIAIIGLGAAVATGAVGTGLLYLSPTR